MTALGASPKGCVPSDDILLTLMLGSLGMLGAFTWFSTMHLPTIGLCNWTCARACFSVSCLQSTFHSLVTDTEQSPSVSEWSHISQRPPSPAQGRHVLRWAHVTRHVLYLPSPHPHHLLARSQSLSFLSPLAGNTLTHAGSTEI